jgi:DNA (cytosine-5)-methyltransferase 1
MNVLDLFSGIGGFSLGLERAGMKTIAFCEVDPKCRQVLRKHWPAVPIYEDIRSLNIKDISEPIDVICGGFPCQDISFAGRGAGLQGERSGLWWEFHRIIKEAKPKWIIIENVSALRSRGLDQVLRSLSEVGYDAEWYCISASSLGAPHQRDRVWIVAYPHSTQCEGRSLSSRIYQEHSNISSQGWWKVEPQVDRVADGLPGRVVRLKQLGNAVVPQIPELIGRSILQ